MNKLKLYMLLLTAMMLFSGCSDEKETWEERLVFEPYDAKIDGICYLLADETKTAVVTAGDMYYAGDVVIPAAVEYEGKSYRVTGIAEKAFASCEQLHSVVLPEGIKTVPARMCAWCYNLESVTLPLSVTSIGNEAFSNCTSMTSVNIPDGVEEIGESAFFCCSSLTSMQIPNSVSVIRWRAFTGCTNLVSVSLPQDLVRIPPECFAHCSRLSSITIPEGVVYISNHSFSHCVSLTQLVLPQSLRSMDRGVFENCTGLTSMMIPDGVEQLGALLFCECSHLTSVIWHPQEVPEGTFKNCIGLVDVEVPEGVTCIYANAYDGCANLSTLRLPSTLETIFPGAFKDCKALKDVYCHSIQVPTLPYPMTSNVDLIFENTDISGATLHVPASAIDAYKTTYPWNTFGTIVEEAKVYFHQRKVWLESAIMNL